MEPTNPTIPRYNVRLAAESIQAQAFISAIRELRQRTTGVSGSLMSLVDAKDVVTRARGRVMMGDSIAAVEQIVIQELVDRGYNVTQEGSEIDNAAVDRLAELVAAKVYGKLHSVLTAMQQDINLIKEELELRS